MREFQRGGRGGGVRERERERERVLCIEWITKIAKPELKKISVFLKTMFIMSSYKTICFIKGY